MANILSVAAKELIADLLAAETWKAALFPSSFTPTTASTGYTANSGSEITGTGYTAGGVPLTPAASAGTTDGLLSFTSPIDFGTVTITDAKWLLIYCDTDAGGKRGFWFDLGTAFDVTGVGLTVTVPTADDTDGLIQIETAA